MKISLAEIATRWEFEPAGVEREIRHDIAMGPKNGCLGCESKENEPQLKLRILKQEGEQPIEPINQQKRTRHRRQPGHR
jgi:hypothetical protein